MNASLIFALSIALAPAEAPTEPAATPAPEHAPLAVALQIDLPQRELMSDFVKEWIVEDMTQALAEEGVEVDPDAATHIHITVRLTGEDNVNASIEARVGRPDSDEPVLHRSFECACGDQQIAKRLGRFAATAAGWLTRTQTTSAVEPPPTSEPPPAPAPTPTPPPEPAPTPQPQPRPMGPLGISGSIVTGLGLAAAVAGVVLWTRDDRIALGDDARQLDATSNRLPGAITLGAGAALIGIGIPLLVTDVVRRRRSKRVSWGPTWNAGPSFSFNARFQP